MDQRALDLTPQLLFLIKITTSHVQGTVLRVLHVILLDCVCAESLQLCPLSLCNIMFYSLPGSSVHGILQARTLEWAAFPSPGDLPHPGVQCESSTLAGGFFITSTTWEALLSHLSLIKSPRGGLYGQYFAKQLSRTQVNHSPQITELVSSRTIICIQGCLTPKPNVFTSRKDNLC